MRIFEESKTWPAMRKRLFLLDAYALIYRSYYAFIKNPRINSKGDNTSAVFGFLNTLEDVLRKENPSHLAVAFDPSGKTFRHEAYEAYKAQREETPETIRWSVPHIKELLQAYRIPILEVPGFEADDVIGTLSKKAVEKGFDVYMMTPDKDYGQLVCEHSFIYKPRYGSSDFEILGPAEVCEKYGIGHTSQIIDLLSLMGDASDNIPGCPGIGKVWAQKLIAQFDNVDNLLQHTDELKGSVKEKIEQNQEMIRFSRFLATIRTDVPVDFKEEDLLVEPRDEEKVKAIFERLEFRSWIGRRSATQSYETHRPEGPTPEAKKNIPQATGPTQIITPAHGKAIFKNDSNPNLIRQKTDDAQLSLWDTPAETPTTEPTTMESNPSPATPLSNPPEEAVKELFPEVGGTDGQSLFTQTNLKDIKTTEHNYYIIDNEEKLNDFLRKINAQEKFCFDTETTGVDVMTASLVGLSFAFRPHEAWYVPCPAEREDCLLLLEKLRPLFENELTEKTGHNIKFDIMMLHRYGIKVQGPLFDTMIAHYLLQPELKHGMDELSMSYLHYMPIPIEALIGEKGKHQQTMRDVPLGVVADYAAEDADITWQLRTLFERKIEQQQLQYLFYQVELPLIYVLADMELTGVSIDTAALKDFSAQLTEALKQKEEEIYELAGERFNINSSKQAGYILFDKLQVADKVKKTKGTKQYSTSEEFLTSIKDNHPIIGKLLEYRGINKLLSTYVDAFPLLINPETNKIHTSFNQTVTATGRLSSSNPNLQNIPIRDEMGKEMRKVFSAGPGEVFLSADYSQIELRIMAHLSQDPNMIEAFNEEKDIHQATAAKIYKVGLDEVTSDMRRKAKTANFGIIYGISNFGLAARMNVSRTEAKTLIDGYFQTYPKVKEYMDNAIKKTQETQYAETLFHRKRYLPDIVSHNAVVRGFAERNAINAPIQGTAADIIKIAMVNIYRDLNKQGLKTKMILQVHDELNFIVPQQELDQVKEIVTRNMENAVHLSVPLRADVGVGSNWLEAH